MFTVHFSTKTVNIVEKCCNCTKYVVISALSRQAGTVCVSSAIAACRTLAPALPLWLGCGQRRVMGICGQDDTRLNIIYT